MRGAFVSSIVEYPMYVYMYVCILPCGILAIFKKHGVRRETILLPSPYDPHINNPAILYVCIYIKRSRTSVDLISGTSMTTDYAESILCLL